MNLSPRSALCAPDRVRSSWARCRLSARAASAESNVPVEVPAPAFWEAEADKTREAWPWLHENLRSSALSSWENCFAFATASAFSSWENWRIRLLEELRRIVDGDREAEAEAEVGVSVPGDVPTPARSSMWMTVAGSTLRRTMVLSSCKSRVTSTNSWSAPELESSVMAGDVPALTTDFSGTESEAHRRSCLGWDLIDEKETQIGNKQWLINYMYW